jgi:hypothetical protein
MMTQEISFKYSNDSLSITAREIIDSLYRVRDDSPYFDSVFFSDVIRAIKNAPNRIVATEILQYRFGNEMIFAECNSMQEYVLACAETNNSFIDKIDEFMELAFFFDSESIIFRYDDSIDHFNCNAYWEMFCERVA